MQTRVTTTIRTTGQADINEHIEFVTKDKLSVGHVVNLRPAKPIASEIYGQATILRYVGPGHDQAHRRYEAVRVN